MFLKKEFNTIYYIILLFFSFFVNQYFGFIGINPIDSFFSFNTGYDILNGRYPFKDYWTITGPFIGLTQALIFKILDVSWSSYVFHASLFNSIITLSTFYTLKIFNLNKHYCFIYSLCVALLAYPSIGTPYVDHHSTYLSVISIFCFILALKTNLSFYWLILPIVLGFSFLTKQAPTGHIFIIISILSLVYFIFHFNIKKLVYGIVGSFITITLFFFFINYLEIPLINFVDQYILFPLSLGESRLEYLFPFEFQRVIMRFKLIHLSALILIYILIKEILNKVEYIKNKEFLILLSLVGMYIALIAHQLMTINGLFIFFVIPILAGFSHLYYEKKFKKKKYIIYLLLILNLGSTFHYSYKYILSRNFNDLSNFDKSKAVNAEILDHKLSGLKWITPLYPYNPDTEIDKIKEAISVVKKETMNKSIITDYQFISIILSTYDNSPSQVWFPYHVNPEIESKYHEKYKKFFIDNLNKNKIDIVFIVKPLWGGDDVFEKALSKDCYKKIDITDILSKYILKSCTDLGRF